MNHSFVVKITIGMVAGLLIGLSIHALPLPISLRDFIVENILQVGASIFLNLIQMLVVPIVLLSLICGASSLGGAGNWGRVGGKTLLLYVSTTALAITLALSFAALFKLGAGLHLTTTTTAPVATIQDPPSMRTVLINLFPANPFLALSQGVMLQIIVFALLFGLALGAVGEAGAKLAAVLQEGTAVFMKMITMIMQAAPYGVFLLLATLFSRTGLSVIFSLAHYFITVSLVLLIQLFVTYSVFLMVLARLSVRTFFKKMQAALLFAFSVSSSNASIPIVLKTVKERLGVSASVAAFVIPLGSTINMDGTAIMQGVATVFIAHAYHIPIGLTGYLTVIAMAVLASIGTAGVPAVGLITLAMVLQQVGLPVEGIALIVGVDRLLDMLRTAVNVSGDAMVACVVAKTEGRLDRAQYEQQTT